MQSTLPTPRRRHLSRLAAALLLAAALSAATAAAADLAFREQSLPLPGAPAALVPADLDGDGRLDLAVVVIYTEWDQIGIEEYTEMDQVEGLVEVLTIVPTLMDRREVRIYRSRPDGLYELAGEPLPLPLDVLTLEAGPPGAPVVALTDAGASELVLDPATGTPALEPILEQPPVLAGTGNFLAGLELVRDVTGDGVPDLLVPTGEGIAVHAGAPTGIRSGTTTRDRSGARTADRTGDRFRSGAGLTPQPVARVPYPVDPESGRPEDAGSGLERDVPLPEVVDVDGDGLPDLVFRTNRYGERVALQRPDGSFAPAAKIAPPEGGEGPAEGGLQGSRVHLGPIDERPGAELVTEEELGDDDAGVRKEMKQAREPRIRVRVHSLDGLYPAPAPDRTFEVKGYLESGGSDFVLPGGFRDLNGDGRADLVTITNDISLFKAMKVLATRRLTLELGFHPWCQGPDGRFHRAPGDPLTSKLHINLNDLEIRKRSLFAGDFDGDGRRDFLQLGRPREVGIHRGRADCSYPRRPDAEIRLRGELRDLALAEILDLDGDGRSDLAVTHPQKVDEPGVSPPVRLDLYVGEGGAR